MRLKELVENCPAAYSEIDVGSLAYKPEQCEKGALFFCLHGEEEAQKAADAAAALFAGGASAANVPSFTLTKAEFAADSRVTTMLVKSGLCKSQSDARNQVKAGAVLVADKKVDDLNATLAESDVPADGLLIQKGKKNFRRLFLA